MALDTLPTLRWGIVGTGMISSWFVSDLSLERQGKKAEHIIQAIGSSSTEKGRGFVEKHLKGKAPTVYGSYQDLYEDANVDILYIGTPHAFHKQNCLDAIRAGKHVLCEKAFALNSREAQQIFDEAKRQGVFVMEAMWTRFFPLVQQLRRVIHHDKVIGDIDRVFCDFAMPMNIKSLPPSSRLRNAALGAGSLLDIGIYSVTWAILALEAEPGQETPTILGTQRLHDGVDVATSVILSYPDGKQGLATCSTFTKTPSSFCRIEGSQGTVTVDGFAASAPAFFTVHAKDQEPQRYDFERPGKGFYWEADAVALDIAAGRMENELMPWSETLRIMRLMDDIRRQGGAKFPQDDEYC
ncbi:hypothetical protein FE257_012487 [Aspergillus nanangensis]|uniref:D-xylose 1-dehydrogenase (NADP(+), D-xylono-1,5-lactone-forming) n=1 Tax=Aspergillus nanangensis TaxID=2582783 RepID=A0AAD4CV15_ASPNN|nr:hypothetical protein FE257_012487 [Aspergillus nanangensis]